MLRDRDPTQELNEWAVQVRDLEATRELLHHHLNDMDDIVAALHKHNRLPLTYLILCLLLTLQPRFSCTSCASCRCEIVHSMAHNLVPVRHTHHLHIKDSELCLHQAVSL